VWLWLQVVHTPMTAAEDDHDVIRAMRLGARGVVLKQSATDLRITRSSFSLTTFCPTQLHQELANT